MFELTHNLDYYLKLNPKRRIRKLKIDRERMATACQEASETLHRYLATVPALQPLRSGRALEIKQAHSREAAIPTASESHNLTMETESGNGRA
jgi:hypothetical protein